MPTYYLDYDNGNDAADGSTFALGGLPAVGPWKTITSGPTAARVVPGDVIRIAKSSDPTSLGQTALWTNASKNVVLQTGAVTAEIDNCEGADANWTESANVTDSDNTSQYKLGANSYLVQIAAAFGTGKATYRDFGAGNEKDLSGYQQISFWLRNTVALASAGDVKIKLCSDAAGDTAVDTFNVPAIPSVNQWIPITVNKGSALGNAIRSVAIYMDTDLGALDLYFDNIIACKAVGSADSLTLQSLISKTSAAQGGEWFAIQSINGTTIMIDNHTNNLANVGRGYAGTTETVTTYKRETIKTALASASDTTVSAIQDSGTTGSNISYQGGYNTATDSQDGETFFDGLNGMGLGLIPNTKNYITLNYLNYYRYGVGFSVATSNAYKFTITNMACCHNTSNGIAFTNLFSSYVNAVTNNNGFRAFFNSGTSNGLTGSIIANNNLSDGVNFGTVAGGIVLTSITAKNNDGYGTRILTDRVKIRSFTSAGNVTAALGYPSIGKAYIRNASIAEATILNTPSDYTDVRAVFEKYGGSATDHRIYTDGGNILSETSVRHTAAGLAWKLSPTSATRSATYPLWLPIAQVAVNADALVTVKAWMRRSHASLTMSLVCRGGQLTGVASDVTASMTEAADTWEEITITFTPTEAGVIEIEAWAYGGTTYSGYVDDMTFTQA